MKRTVSFLAVRWILDSSVTVCMHQDYIILCFIHMDWKSKTFSYSLFTFWGEPQDYSITHRFSCRLLPPFYVFFKSENWKCYRPTVINLPSLASGAHRLLPIQMNIWHVGLIKTDVKLCCPRVVEIKKIPLRGHSATHPPNIFIILRQVCQVLAVACIAGDMPF